MQRAAIALSVGLFAGAAAAAPQADVVHMTQLAEAFSDFAGSTANAQSLVDGLHGATAVTLLDASNAPRSFTPATKPMGWRDVRIALGLAQAELAAAGIAHPTPVDIDAVLNGGTAGSGYTMTHFTGVLTQRWSGLAWHQIALAHNLSLDLAPGNVIKAVNGPGVPQQAGSTSEAVQPAATHAASTQAALGSASLRHRVSGATVAATAAAAAAVQ